MVNNQRKFGFLRNVILKTTALFFLVNVAWAIFQPIDSFGRISFYNILFQGRLRLPFGERPDLAYNLSIDNLDAMFSSHIINAPKNEEDEFKVLLFGDSSVWGYLLLPEETLSEKINQANATLKDGRTIKAYNLGYPTISLTKDILFMNQSLKFHPDLIIWLVTLEAFPRERQLDSPFLQNNSDLVLELIQEFDLHLDIPESWYLGTPLWSKTIVAQRRELADIFRLQLYGVMWSATGIDQYYPENYEAPLSDFDNNLVYYQMLPTELDTTNLAFEMLSVGEKLADDIPLIIVNEPIYRSSGINSDIRYNFFYPRWAYDQYRMKMQQFAKESTWDYLDAWDLVAPTDFTNSAIHLNSNGSQLLADAILSHLKIKEAAK